MNHFQFTIKSIVVLSLLTSSLYAQSDLLVVSSRGLGTTADAAKDDALINAMQQAVGAFIDGETIIENDQIIKDKILSVSDGFVDSYDIVTGPEKRADGLFEITIKAKVKKGKVVERLEEVRVTGVGVLGKDAAAELTTKIANWEQGEELLEKHLEGLMEKLLVARLVDRDGKPGEQIKPITKILPDRRIECQWNIEVYFDLKSYYEQVVPQLDKVFEAVSIERDSPFTCLGKKYAATAVTKYPVLEFEKWQGVSSKKLNEDEVLVGLSIGRDRFGENERFKSFVLNRNLYSAILSKVANSAATVKLHLFALDDNGGIIRREIVELSSAHLANKSGSYQCLPNFLRTERSLNDVFLLSPRFAGPDYNGAKTTSRNLSAWGYGDAIFIPFKVVLEQEDIERISDVRFQFAK